VFPLFFLEKPNRFKAKKEGGESKSFEIGKPCFVLKAINAMPFEIKV